MSALKERLADLQARRPWAFLLVGLLLAAGSLPLVGQLGLNSDWTALLPEDKPSVVDLEAARGRVGGMTTLIVALQSPSRDLEGMQEAARALVPRLRELDELGVRSVDWNVASYEDFVWQRRHLFASEEDLREIRDELEARLEYERARANPFYVDLGDEEPESPTALVERMRARAEAGRQKMARFPGGFYVSEERDLLALFLRTDLSSGDVEGAARLTDAVHREVEAVSARRLAPDLRIEFTGDLITAREEHDAIARELAIATGLTVVLVLTVIWVFFLRWRSIPILGLTLSIPVLVTFAFAELTVDYLNTSTAFLGSIVIGNGINPNIMWLARYFEERRRGRDVRDAIAITHEGTWAATFTASLAAATAYGSLVVTDFRGFRDFGVIGGFGMVMCWLGAIVLLPAFAATFERFRPLVKKGEQVRVRNLYGRAFSALVWRSPRGVIAVSALLAVLGIGLVGWAVWNDPLEYDFRNLRSVREDQSDAHRLNVRIQEIVGKSASGNTIAILVPAREDVAPVRAQLERMRHDRAAPFGRVRTIDDLLPDDQEDKLPVLAEIRTLLLDARRFADDEQRRQIDEHIPPEDLHAVGDADLPEDVARPFTERDGTRGRIVFVEPVEGRSVWDGRYLVDWSTALRELRLPDESRPPLVGRAPVFADMLEVIWTDGPIAVLASFVATFLLVLLTFRRMAHRTLTIVTLLLGIVWMAACMAVLGMKLNFLNFVAFPVTFGNGVDYGVNVMRRYVQERRGGHDADVAIRASIEESGGAVILCSMTTVFGYISLYTSANLALNSFGAAMSISEVTCVAAAVLTMPAIMLWQSRRGAVKPGHGDDRAIAV